MDGAYTTDLQVRFRDIDPLYHVSHTVYVVYMQQARLDFSEEVLDLRASAHDTVVAHLEIDYRTEVTVDDEVTVHTWVSDVGSTSFTTGYAITAGGERAATGESVQVVVEGDTGDSTAIPPEWRDSLETHRLEDPLDR